MKTGGVVLAMKVLNILCLSIALFIPMPIAANTSNTSNIFKSNDKIYITKLKPKTKVEISLQRITFRKLVADNCGEISFESITVPVLVLVDQKLADRKQVESEKLAESQKLIESQKFIPAKFTLEATRACTKDSPKSDRSYKVSNTRFVLAGLKSQTPYLIKIIKSAPKNLTTNRCGYGSIPITQSLTSFASSYEDNIYAINGKKLKDLAVQKPLTC